MKVYVVWESEDTGIQIIDIFSSKEKAEQCCAERKIWAQSRLYPEIWYYDFDEYEVK